MLWMKTNKFQRNMKKFGRVLKKKLKPLMVAKKLNMGKIFKKLGLNLMAGFSGVLGTNQVEDQKMIKGKLIDGKKLWVGLGVPW